MKGLSCMVSLFDIWKQVIPHWMMHYEVSSLHDLFGEGNLLLLITEYSVFTSMV